MSLWSAYLDLWDRYVPFYSRPDQDDEDDGPSRCERCDTALEPSVGECISCGNNPGATAKRSGLVLGLVGIGITVLTGGVGILVGGPLLLVGLLAVFGARTLSPTDHDFS